MEYVKTVGSLGRGFAPAQVTHQSDVVRGVGHARQGLVGGDLLVRRQRDHLLHLQVTRGQETHGIKDTTVQLYLLTTGVKGIHIHYQGRSINTRV